MVPGESSCPDGSKYVWQRGITEALRPSHSRLKLTLISRKKYLRRCSSKLAGRNFWLNSKTPSTWTCDLNTLKEVPNAVNWNFSLLATSKSVHLQNEDQKTLPLDPDINLTRASPFLRLPGQCIIKNLEIFYLIDLLISSMLSTFQPKNHKIVGFFCPVHSVSHWLHLCYFSSGWIFKCLLKSQAWTNWELHWSHLKDFSPEWNLKCLLKLPATADA